MAEGRTEEEVGSQDSSLSSSRSVSPVPSFAALPAVSFVVSLARSPAASSARSRSASPSRSSDNLLTGSHFVPIATSSVTLSTRSISSLARSSAASPARSRSPSPELLPLSTTSKQKKRSTAVIKDLQESSKKKISTKRQKQRSNIKMNTNIFFYEYMQLSNASINK